VTRSAVSQHLGVLTLATHAVGREINAVSVAFERLDAWPLGDSARQQFLPSEPQVNASYSMGFADTQEFAAELAFLP